MSLSIYPIIKTHRVQLLLTVMVKSMILLILTMTASHSYGQSAKIDSLKVELKQRVSTDSLAVELSIAISRALNKDHKNESQELKYADLAITHAVNSKDSLLYAKALDNKGVILRYNQRYAEAIPLHIKAYNLIKDKDVDDYYKMRFPNNAAVSFRYQQEYGQSVAYFLIALKIAEEINDLRNIAIASNGIGNSLSYIEGREDESLTYFEDALAAEEKRGNTLGMAINYLSIANYYTKKQQFKTAKRYLDELMVTNENRNDIFGIGMTHEYKGHNLFEEGIDYVAALGHYEKALRIFKQINNRTRQAEMYRSIGNVHFQLKQLGQAKQKHEISLAMAESLDDKELIKENAYALSKIYENKNEHAKALQYLKIGQEYKDIINIEEQNARITGLKLNYDFDKKESEIALLKKDKVIKDAELLAQSERLRRQNAIIALSFVTIGGVIILFILAYRNISIKKNAKIKLKEEEKKRIQSEYEKNLLQAEVLASRMQMNPHFLFNCLNSIKYLIQKEEAEKAIKYLTTFSRFIRSILESGKQKQISLFEELEIVTKYILLEENRFDENFTFQLENECTDQESKEIPIPPLLLQPFVENAIWHGLLPDNKPIKKLTIRVKQKDQSKVSIEIEDNGVGRKEIEKSGSNLHKSMGTKITQDRIDLFNQTGNLKVQFQTIDLTDHNGNRSGTKIIIDLIGTNDYIARTDNENLNLEIA
ncbi:MAG: histidine kinase [Cyclobacteriaceae bacterium]|nr:histidine kinase [Cyclobacteriaceae bacterium]MCH8515841.1 histidine kinase [Cyclobacteriaceae bacterium]